MPAGSREKKGKNTEKGPKEESMPKLNIRWFGNSQAKIMLSNAYIMYIYNYAYMCVCTYAHVCKHMPNELKIINRNF